MQTGFTLPDRASWISNMTHRSEKMAVCGCRPYKDSGSFVFTHGDLNMRNVILGADGQVWLIDFGWSGYYPPAFEHIAASMSAVLVDYAPWSWRILVPFITGAYFYDEVWAYEVSVS